MMDYRIILRRVGLAWIGFGLLDIGLMIYCLMQSHNYSSSFNLFAVILDLFLYRGSLGATTLVTWFSAFMLMLFAGGLLLAPLLQPVGLLVSLIRLHPGQCLLLGVYYATMVGLLIWTYRQIRSTPVLEARRESGRRTGRPQSAFLAGFLLVVFIGVLFNVLLKGSAGTKAVELARQKLGPDYHYAIQSIRVSGKAHSGVVAAYNAQEIKYVPVFWNE